MTKLRSDMPPNMPERMQRLPVSDRGFPVPWFVEWIKEPGSEEAAPVGEGYPEFRIMRHTARKDAILKKLCWVCGQPLGKYMSFVAGPMCAVNRTTAEPPSHRDCAEWSANACPFLSNPKMTRRENQMTDKTKDMPGDGILRNPGVAMVWTCNGYQVFQDGKGSYLIEMGPPTEVDWFAHGRPATRQEVFDAIESGLPILGEPINEQPVETQDASRAQLRSLADKVIAELIPS